MSIKKKLKGPIFSIITPFKKNEEIDYDKLEKYIDYLYLRGARIFYVMVYNSRLGLLNYSEIINLNIFCIKKIKKINKNNIIICAEPYHCSTQQSIELVNLFQKKGADIVSLIFGEKYYSDEQIYSHFKKIHDNTNAYLLLHQQQMEPGIASKMYKNTYPLSLLNKIFSLKKFIAMKEDAKDDVYTKKICKILKNKAAIITSGRGKKQWVKASKYGCQSWLSGISTIDPKIAVSFYHWVKTNKKNKINFYFKYIEGPFLKISDNYGWHLTIKAFLELKGHFKRYERSPLMKMDNKKFKLISEKSKNIFKNINKII